MSTNERQNKFNDAIVIKDQKSDEIKCARTFFFRKTDEVFFGSGRASLVFFALSFSG